VILGAGVGWMEAEFAALGVPFRERGRRMDEGIAMMRGGVERGPGEFSGAPHPGGDRGHAHAAAAGQADPDLDRRQFRGGTRAGAAPRWLARLAALARRGRADRPQTARTAA